MKKYMDIRITATSEEDLANMIELFMYISECGQMGAGKTFNVVVDGDGSGRYSFNILDIAEDEFHYKAEEIKFSDDARKIAQEKIRSKKPITVYLGE